MSDVKLFTILMLWLAVGTVSGSSNKSSSNCCLQNNQDWYKHMHVYNVLPRSFKDSDGDGIGDLKGITSNLLHFVECGVDAIWLGPIFSSPQVDFGYDITDHCSINEEYGTMEDFEELLQQAHELGLRVILDYIPNHMSTQSEQFKRSVKWEEHYEDFFIWADPRQDPNNSSNKLVPSNWISEFGGSAWKWNEDRQQYYFHHFDESEADVNFFSSAVKKMQFEAIGCWLDKGVDGLRASACSFFFEAGDSDGKFPDEPLSANRFISWDQPGYTTREYTKDLIGNYVPIYEWRQNFENWTESKGTGTKILIAEPSTTTNISRTIMYYGNQQQSKPGAHFPLNFEFITSLSSESNANDFVYSILKWLVYQPYGTVANWVLANQDCNRTATRFGEHMVNGLNALIMTLPGVAVTYQGDEIGMHNVDVSWDKTKDIRARRLGNKNNYEWYSRDFARTPYQWDNSTSAGFSDCEDTWLPVGSDYKTLNLYEQKRAKRSNFKVFKALAKLRKTPTLIDGQVDVRSLSINTIVLVRYGVKNEDSYALIFNVGKENDNVDLRRSKYLSESMYVYISSVNSSRKTGDVIPYRNITLKAGELLVVRIQHAKEICH